MAEWDPTRFVVTVGALTISEYAAGTFIKAAYNNDLYSLTMGADGAGCRVRSADESGTFEITLLSSSMSNDALAALALLDRQSAQGIVPVQVKDKNGTAVASAANAWIKKPADLERAKELGEVTWTFETPKLKLLTGGIPQFGTTVPQ